MHVGLKVLLCFPALIALLAKPTYADSISDYYTLSGKLCFYSLDLELPGLSKNCPGDTIELERKKNVIVFKRQAENRPQKDRSYSVASHSSRFAYLNDLEDFVDQCISDIACNSHEAMEELRFLAGKNRSYIELNETYDFLGQTFEYAPVGKPSLFRKDIVYDKAEAFFINHFSLLNDGMNIFFSAAELTNFD